MSEWPHTLTSWILHSGPAVYGSEEDYGSVASSGWASEPSPDDTVGDQDSISPSEDLCLYFEQMV